MLHVVSRWLPYGRCRCFGWGRLQLVWMLVTASLPLGLSSSAAEPRFTLREDQQGVELVEGDEPVFFFQLREKTLDGKWPRSHYLHPVYDVAGKPITEDFPADHRHHRGIFWAWHQLKLHGKPLADPWICQGIRWAPPGEGQDAAPKPGDGFASSDRWPHVHWRRKADRATLRVVRNWTVEVEGRPTAVVEDRVAVTAWASDGAIEAGKRRLDFEIQLRPLLPGIEMGGSENAKGYGGFSTRIALQPPVTFVGDRGPVEPQVTAVEAGRWLSMIRDVQGKRARVESLAHVTIFCHPSHPGFPAPWILRRQRSMQNVAWPGRHPVKLDIDKPTVLRYRLLIHKDPLEPKQLEAEWKAYVRLAS